MYPCSLGVRPIGPRCGCEHSVGPDAACGSEFDGGGITDNIIHDSGGIVDDVGAGGGVDNNVVCDCVDVVGNAGGSGGNDDDIHGCVVVVDNCGGSTLDKSLPYGSGWFSDDVTLYRVSTVRHTSLNLLFLFTHLQIYSLTIFSDI